MNIATIRFKASIYKESSMVSTTQDLGEHQTEMTLYINDQDSRYGSIEWDIPSLDEFVDIGLVFAEDRTTLIDYDGTFSLPSQAIQLLRDEGFIVPEDFE